MKRFITSVALLMCIMLISGSIDQLLAQPNAAGGPGGGDSSLL